MAVLEIPHSQSTAVPSVTYKLLVASWHQRKGTFLEHFFGAGSTDAVLPLGPWQVPLLSRPEGFQWSSCFEPGQLTLAC